METPVARRIGLQKLFSAFPSGWPGLGLLLLRALVGFTLVAQCLAYIGSMTLSPINWIVAVAVLIGAACLLVGFVTPVIAIVTGLAALTLQFFDAGQTLVNIVVLAAAIALLGPGAFSIDARMFGRREILISSPTRPSKSLT